MEWIAGKKEFKVDYTEDFGCNKDSFTRCDNDCDLRGNLLDLLVSVAVPVTVVPSEWVFT